MIGGTLLFRYAPRILMGEGGADPRAVCTLCLLLKIML
jgi:hypothetical protein